MYSNYLALDQALQKTGWACYKNKQLVGYGTYEVPSNLPMEERLAKIWIELSNLYHEFEFEEIVFEGIQNQNNNETYKRLAYVQAAIMLWCYVEDIKYTIMTPSEWRGKLKCSFGKKREEQKLAAMRLVQDVFDRQVSTDEADAICIGLAYRE